MIFVWMPTWDCNLRCVHCSARHLPKRLYGKSVKPEKWVEALSQYQIKELHISGGEPSLYDVATVIEALQVPFTIDTNLRRSPEHILRNEDIARLCRSFNVSLQIQPEHNEAQTFWDYIDWIRANYPNLQIVLTYVAYWREPQSVWEEVRRLCEKKGVALYLGSWDWRFMCDEPPKPRYVYVGKCSAGHNFAVLAPDGSVHRCIGWLYRYMDKPSLGNIFAHDRESIFADKPQPCDYPVCTVCDMVEKENEIKWQDLGADEIRE